MAKVWQLAGLASALVLAAYLGGPDAVRAQAVQRRAPAITLPDGQSQRLAPAPVAAPAPVSNDETAVNVMTSAATGRARSPAVSSSYSSPAIPPAGAPVAGQNWPGMVRAAGVYALYRADVRRAAAAPPVSAEDLERLLTRLAGYDGTRLSLAFRAHAVMLAMQSPAFAAGVQQWGKTYDRRAIIANLRSNSAYANRIPGYQQAVTHILEAARDDAATIHLAGGIYKDLAYSLQHKRWALKVRRGKSLLLAAVHNAATDPPPPPPAMLLMVQQDYARSLRLQPPPALHMASASASAGAMLSPLLRSLGPGPAQAARADAMAAGPALIINPAHVGAVQDIVASAAEQMLDHSAPFPDRLSQRRGADSFAECVDWARMHLNQCVAATHYVYEDSFCIAEHQLKDTASCLADFAVSP